MTTPPPSSSSNNAAAETRIDEFVDTLISSLPINKNDQRRQQQTVFVTRFWNAVANFLKSLVVGTDNNNKINTNDNNNSTASAAATTTTTHGVSPSTHQRHQAHIKPINDNCERVRVFKEQHEHTITGIIEGALLINLQSPSQEDEEGNDTTVPTHHTDLLRKNPLIADKFRAEGNAAYKSKNLGKALCAYTLACSYAPSGSREHALAYSNRSACFVEQNELKLALADIARFESIAKSWKEPADLRIIDRVKERKARCDEKAAELDQKQKQEKKQQQNDDDYDDHHHQNESANTTTGIINEVFKLRDPSFTIPAAERFVGILEDETRGRFLANVGNSVVPPGTLIILERPFASVLLSAYKFEASHCTNCFKDLKGGGIPCAGCVFALFCSPECASSSKESQHTRYECKASPYLHELNMNRTTHLALQTLFQMTPVELLQHYYFYYNSKKENEQKDEEKEESADVVVQKQKQILISGFSQSGKYESTSYVTINSLIHHESILSENEIIRYCTDAVVITEVIDRTTDYFSSLNDTTAISILKEYFASLILLHQMNFPCNAHSLYKLNPPPGDDNGTTPNTSVMLWQYEEFGAAAFPLLSLLNHSCDPNVVRVTLPGGVNAVVTIQHVPVGAEFLDNYGHHFATEDLRTRQAHLSNSYNFRCRCPACTGDWPLIQQLMAHSKKTPPKMICPKCRMDDGSNQNLIQQNLTSTTSNLPTCPKCGTAYPAVEAIALSHQSMYESVSSNLMGGELPARWFRNTVHCLTYYDRSVRKPFAYVNMSQEMLKQVLFAVAREMFR